MKKITLILISFYVFLYNNSFAQCSRFFATQPINYVYDKDKEVYPNNINFVNYTDSIGYNIYHRFEINVNTSLDIIDIKNPIILVKGYDPQNEITCHDSYNYYFLNKDIKYNNELLGNYLRNKGYDIITYNVGNTHRPIQVLAKSLQQFIKFINQNKKGHEELVVIGVSQGGLVARYALTEMENNNETHSVKLFVTLDTPHKGANIPVGLQALLIKFEALKYFVKELKPLYDSYRSASARQMTLYNPWKIKNDKVGSTDAHLNFYSELKTLNSCNGYPKNCKRSAIANGGLNGFNDMQGNVPGSTAAYIPLFSNAGVGIQTVPDKDYANTRTGEKGTFLFNSNWFQPSFYLKSINPPIDNCPGGYYPFFKELKSNLASVKTVDIAYENANFVSTNSAFDICNTDILQNLGVKWESDVMKLTPFDDIYWNTDQNNTYHASLTNENTEWLVWQIENFNKLPYQIDSKSEHFNLSLNAKNWQTGSSETYKAVNNLTITNSSLDTASRVTLIAGNTIKITNLILKNGSNFKAFNDKILLPKCVTNFTFDLDAIVSQTHSVFYACGEFQRKKINSIQKPAFKVENAEEFPIGTTFSWSVTPSNFTSTGHQFDVSNFDILKTEGTYSILCIANNNNFVSKVVATKSLKVECKMRKFLDFKYCDKECYYGSNNYTPFSVLRIENKETSNDQIHKLENDLSKHTFTILPNPANDFITISDFKKDNDYQITINDVHNKVIYETNVTNLDKIEIQTSNFSSGIYFITIKSNNYIEYVSKISVIH